MEVRTVNRVIVDYTTREGVPTRAECKIPEANGVLILEADQDTQQFYLHVESKFPSAPSNLVSREIDDEDDRGAHRNRPTAGETAPISPVARWTTGVVALAILTPFVGILWAWAMGVIDRMGGGLWP